jgi:hypothetical protein
MTFYSIDHAPHTVNRNGHPEITAWSLRSARDGFVGEDPGHRRTVTSKDAGPLCKQWYRCSLSEALVRGLI